VSLSGTASARPGILELASAQAAPLAAGSLAVILGALFLDRKSIWVDESFSYEWAAKSLGAQPGGDHWLYYATLKGWTAIAGTSEAAMRLPSVAAAGLAAALLVLLGRRLLGPVPGVLAGLLLASNPFFVTWSQQARGYTMLVLLAILSTLALEGALERATARRWLLYAGLLALTMVWQVFGALLVPVHLARVLSRRREVPLRYPIAGFAVALAAFASWLLTVATRSENNGETTWRTRPDVGEVVLSLFRLSGPALIGLLLAAFGAFLLVRDPARRRLGWFVVAWAALPIAITLLGLLVKPVFLDRYVLVTAPAFALLGGAALATLRYRPAILLSAVAVAVPTVATLAFWYDDRGIENWRGAVAATRTEPGAEVVVTPFWAMPAYRYYAGGDASLEPHAGEVWVVAEGFSTAHASENGRDAIGERPYVLVSEQPFGRHLRLQRWRRAPGG
jgi:mannosyltransferase